MAWALQPEELSAKTAKLVWYCYFLLGVGILAPWNAFITATDYFEAAFPGAHVDRLFSICYMPTCLLLLVVCVTVGHAAWLPHPATRITLCYAAFTLLLGVVPLVDVFRTWNDQSSTGTPTASSSNGIHHDSSNSSDSGIVHDSTSSSSRESSGGYRQGRLVSVLLSVVAVGALDGASQGAVFSAAAQHGAQYTQAVAAGTAFSGLLVSLLRLACKAAFASAASGSTGSTAWDLGTNITWELRASTYLYFGLGSLLTLSCAVVYRAVLPKLLCSMHHTSSLPATHMVDPSNGGASASIDSELVPLRHDDTRGSIRTRDHSSNGAHMDGPVAEDVDSISLSPAAGVAAADVDIRLQLLGHAAAAGGTSSTEAVQPHGLLLYRDETETMAEHTAADGGQRPSHGWQEAGKHLLLLHERHVAHTQAQSRGSTDCQLGAAACFGSSACHGCSNRVRQQRRIQELRECWQLVWPYGATLFATYAATLCIFPGFLAEDLHSDLLGDWYPLLIITVFNATDMLGKLLAPTAHHDSPISRAMETSVTDEHWSGTPTAAQAGSKRTSDKGMACDQSCMPEEVHLLSDAGRAVQAVHSSTSTDRVRGLYSIAASIHRQPIRLAWLAVVRGGACLLLFLVVALTHSPAGIILPATMILGLSNGWLTVCAMSGVPPHLADHGEGLLVVCLVAGLTAGAFLGWLWLL